ncbi:uncharacterized protein LOC119955543 [Scyliorhinus canicula]|uniref:uncharacterized protein LOC119955543 n=1 Tax=Scyliorhinus canicula TaxID=7830 RepID=UPI0018F505C3|nr:uncharacterized protein LOC119955543 [Scyliorhinus canicula]
MEVSECELERQIPDTCCGPEFTDIPSPLNSQFPTADSIADPGSGAETTQPGKTLSMSPGCPDSPNADEIRMGELFNEQAAIANIAQSDSFPEFENNCFWYGMESREQTPRPISLESDFVASFKLAAVLTLVFVAVTIVLVSSNQSEPFLIHPDLTKFNGQDSLNHKLHKLRVSFPSQSEAFWKTLENHFNHHLAEPAATLECWLVGVGFEDSWNTMFCLAKIIVKLLLVNDGHLAPNITSKMLDYSHIFWSQRGLFFRPGTCVIVIAKSISSQSYATTLTLRSANTPTAPQLTLISVKPVNMGPEEEVSFENCTLRILHNLNLTEQTNTEFPNTPLVVKREDYLESDFLC